MSFQGATASFTAPNERPPHSRTMTGFFLLAPLPASAQRIASGAELQTQQGLKLGHLCLRPNLALTSHRALLLRWNALKLTEKAGSSQWASSDGRWPPRMPTRTLAWQSMAGVCAQS